MAAWEIKVWESAIKTEGAIIVFINSSSQGENETRAFTLRLWGSNTYVCVSATLL